MRASHCAGMPYASEVSKRKALACRGFIAFISIALFSTVLFAATIAHPVAAQEKQGDSVEDSDSSDQGDDIDSPPPTTAEAPPPPTTELVQPDEPTTQRQSSPVVFAAPTGLIVGKNRTLQINAYPYIVSGHAISSCGSASGITADHLTSVSNVLGSCTYTVDPVNTFQGNTTFTIPYSFTDGSTYNGQVSVTIGPDSDISYSGPTQTRPMSVKHRIRTTIDAAVFASDGDYEIQCTRFLVPLQANSVTIHSNVGCVVDFTAALGGTGARFEVDYQSSGGDTSKITIWLANNTGTSRIQYTAPTGLFVQLGLSTTIDASTYAREDTRDYRVFCISFDQADLDLIVSQNGCNFTVRPSGGATAGDKSFRIRYSSSGGSSAFGTVTIAVTAASDITYTEPVDLQVAKNRTKTINALDYVTETDSQYTITCADATSIDTTELQTVTRPDLNKPCEFLITPKSVEGAATFTINYSSTGGDTLRAVVSITVGPDSTITFTAPTGLTVGTNRTRTIDASAYAAEAHSGYSITCGNATSVDTDELQSVTRPDAANKPCEFLIDPKTVQGSASFTVPYTSEGGHTVNGVVPITVGARDGVDEV